MPSSSSSSSLSLSLSPDISDTHWTPHHRYPFIPIIDILVMTDPANDPKTKQPLATIQAVFNNYYTDAFFVKTMGLNGVCPAWCKSGSKFPKPKPYGGIQYVCDIPGVHQLSLTSLVV
eukprot:TRINITY_DN1006_c0_g1_i11.p1 TRINITY_DN1006_c0_g1~~TRINITY_DN1006_c0_g1_i11.p1  ORF type:complete len:118 (+),score=27.54 TRINITY_DN1006_c0_g1_i11:237-590(+)